MDLIEADTVCLRTLDMSYTAVDEFMPIDLHLTKDLLYFGKDFLDAVWFSGALEIIHMFGHDAN